MKFHIVKLLFPITFLLFADMSLGVPLVPPGIHAKAGAGGGQTTSRGPASLFYNPANLIYMKWIEPYLDVGFASLTYQYQPVDDTFEPTSYSQSGPPVTFGLGFRPIPSLSLGFAYIKPLNTSYNATAVPMNIEGSLIAYDVVVQKAMSHMALGAAFRIAHPLTIGVGMTINSDKQATQYLDDQGEAVVDELYEASYNQIYAGIRSEIIDRALVLGVSYRTASPVNYAGNSYLATTESEDFEEFVGVGYAPGAIGFGLESRFGMFGGFVDVLMEQWSGGRALVRRGFPDDPLETDLVDTMNISGGLKLWVAPKHMVQVGFGIYPANVGDGVLGEDGETALHKEIELHKSAATTMLQDTESEDDGSVAGAQFGDPNAIAKTTFSAGYRAKITGHGYFHSGFQMASGSRTVPEGFDGEGNYLLKIMVFGLGVAFGF
jgi:hypothetical protein